ncbi:hypothetical protein [Pseudonocardia humida]|uniref:Uncharacterized protein n=1 Tax=Pseudonocardia humida TaxID=2800819 RepID=A0ABT0ZVR8_9PSEU|nr:hypothetical protein [Pseudonocardia humida]MCO1654770.1 hypothetical protein [Pseudonocardia humida]
MNIVFLIVAIPAIIIAAVLYATVAEIRHNRMRRSRWDLRGTTLKNDGPELLPAGRGD